ncbi:MAG: outer membrane beta-barrel protein [Bacteroidota bacterium]
MHDQYIEELIKHKLGQLELMLKPEDWNLLSEKISIALETHIAEKLSTYKIDLDSKDWDRIQDLLNTAFDEEIRSILQDHKIELNSSDWALLATQLEDQGLEEHIVRSIESLEMEPDAQDWKIFGANLDEHSLDTQVRESLEQLELQASLSDWAAFEEKIETEFDEQIKSKLAGLYMSGSAADWSAMTKMLDGDSFFSDIREGLEGLNIPVSSQDWRVMEDKLNQPLYTAFQEKFAFLNLHPQKGDWKAMEARLQEEEDTRVPVILPWYAQSRTYMIAASILILFLLAPFWIGKDGLNINRKSASEIATNSSPSTNNPLDNIENKLSTKAENSLNSPATANDLIVNSSSAKTEKETKLLSQNLLDMSNDMISAAASATISSFQESFDGPNPIEAQPAIDFSLQPELNLTEGLSLDNALLAQENGKRNKKQNPRVNSGPSREGFLKEIPLKAFANPWKMGLESHVKDIQNISFFKRRRSPFRLGLFGASSKSVAEINKLRSSSTSTLPETHRAGIRAEFNIKNNLNFITGLTYEKRQFTHNYITFETENPNSELFLLDPDPTHNFFNADMQLIQLPLILRAYTPSNGKLSLFLQGGIIPMISMKDVYSHTQITAKNPSESEIKSNGITQTQQWRFNTYPGNLNAALGMEYRIDPKLALQFEAYGLMSLQNFKASGDNFNLDKKMYTIGIGVTVLYGFFKK